ncbi:MAG: hypothetical protein H7Y36_00815 [Armatimonadetes bacterium]|nr:hypothetical protein [Akkermansiaceae bacterium]
MKSTSTLNSSLMGALRKGALISGLWILSCGISSSQSADIFEPENASSKHGDEKKQEKDEPEPGPVNSEPSRFAGQDIDPYIAARAAVFSMRDRDTDPFGLSQDPDAKPVVRKLVSNMPGKRQAALPPVPLAEIVKLIHVTTVMPSEKKFLVGTRAFSKSDEFPLIFQGKTLRMKVIEVSSKRIGFRNLDTGETAAIEMGMLPPGMMAGDDQLRPPGMVTPLENMPLTLESGQAINPNN